ncbi:hypothetical protein [Rhodococcus sp. MEB064]|uniref:hypothetical protein n=1 Tax=Rhodococcus sp. MEB064 TaxID=1587522 RepID=UPI0005ABDC0A|nr:hypothetical protein [Rhodococcus sp. MEB064]KIQ18292.1 hypothetical protein RU01_07935 [Rhodococcus sp. MEB064]
MIIGSVGRIVGSALTVVATSAVMLAPTATAAPPGAPPIAQARAQGVGATVTVSGTITTPPGAFESSFFDVGFAVEDRTAGIYISAAERSTLGIGTAVTVTGTLADQSGLLVVKPTAITPIGPADPVAPRRVVTRVIGESTESSLVTTVGRVTSPVLDDLPFGRKFTIADQSGETTVYINTQTGIDTSAVRVGSVVQVTGMSSQYEDHYEIDARFPADLVVQP